MKIGDLCIVPDDHSIVSIWTTPVIMRIKQGISLSETHIDRIFLVLDEMPSPPHFQETFKVLLGGQVVLCQVPIHQNQSFEILGISS